MLQYSNGFRTSSVSGSSSVASGIAGLHGSVAQNFLRVEIGDVGRFLVANLSTELVDDKSWPSLQAALRQLSTEQFHDLCENLPDEMIRRRNNLGDEAFSALHKGGLEMFRDQIRRKISSLQPLQFERLCYNICAEIERRYPGETVFETNIRKASSLSSGNSYVMWKREFSNLLDNGNRSESRSRDRLPRNYFSELQEYEIEKAVTSFKISSDIYFALTVATICDIFAEICRDQKRLRKLLESSKETAQRILNLVHMLLDYSHLDDRLHSSLFLVLVRLSAKSGLYPQCYALKGVQCENLAVTAGHFGEIWKGKFKGQIVCLKVVKVYQKSCLDHLLKAFSKEAIIWGQVSHPNLLPFYGIYHLNEEHGRICLVSPWMTHGNINEYLGSYPKVNRGLLVSDILEGILYLHERNIIHGDLKGANILVTATKRACLADFGLSRVIDAEMQRWSSIQSTQKGGTVRWQAPELLNPENEDERESTASDIYAFACVCYEVFTGQVPFFEIVRDPTVILKVIQGHHPSRPAPDSHSYREWGMSKALWMFMEMCWKFQPSLRPTANEALKILPVNRTNDTRIHSGWDDLHPSRFRSAIHGGGSISPRDLDMILSWL